MWSHTESPANPLPWSLICAYLAQHRCAFCLSLVIRAKLFFFWSFVGQRPKWFWNGWTKLSHFDQSVWKYRLTNSLQRVLIQLWDKWAKCLSKTHPKCLSEKKQGQSDMHPTKVNFRSLCCSCRADRVSDERRTNSQQSLPGQHGVKGQPARHRLWGGQHDHVTALVQWVALTSWFALWLRQWFLLLCHCMTQGSHAELKVLNCEIVFQDLEKVLDFPKCT